MMKASAKFVSTVPDGILAEIQSVAALHGASEVWLFGSSANRDTCAEPNDWDFAMLGVPIDRWTELSNCLRQRFRSCTVESVHGYGVRPKATSSDHNTPLHFVLGSRDIQRPEHPIFASIRSGMRIYQAA